MSSLFLLSLEFLVFLIVLSKTCEETTGSGAKKTNVDDVFPLRYFAQSRLSLPNARAQASTASSKGCVLLTSIAITYLFVSSRLP